MLGASLALMFLCSCTAPDGTRWYDGNPQVFDVRQIKQPIVINENPFLASPTNIPPELTKVDIYTAEVNDTISFFNNPATENFVNNPRENALQKIDGETNRMIHNMTLQTSWVMFAGFLLFGDGGGIRCTGDVAEFQGPLTVPVRQSWKNAATNQMIPTLKIVTKKTSP
jgi:hypothetical protein